MKVYPTTFGSAGGVTTTDQGRVTTQDGTVIPGLYAAGECASVGTWGANPIAVNGVFGRIAGQSAVSFLG